MSSSKKEFATVYKRTNIVYYAIFPKLNLLKLIDTIPTKNSWAKSSLWIGEESVVIRRGYPSAEMTTKFAFMISKLNESAESSDLSSLISVIFGSPEQLTVEIFDKWWDIKPLDVGEDFEYIGYNSEKIIKSASQKDLEKIEPITKIVDRWIQRKIKWMIK